MSDWYYQVMGEITGPVSLDELRKKVEEGEILSETFVREGAKGQWVPASRVDAIFPADFGLAPSALEEGREPLDGADLGLETEGVLESVAEQSREFQRSPLGLRPCSDCGQMVSRQANHCPHCGRPFREASPTITYRGEQPIPVLVFFAILAIVFILATSVAVYFGVAKLSGGALEDNWNWKAGLATLIYVLTMVTCAILGGAVGKPRMAYLTGILLGSFFGPLGLFLAFAIDKRPHCVHCFSRLNGLASECPSCHSRLLWHVETSWY